MRRLAASSVWALALGGLALANACSSSNGTTAGNGEDGGADATSSSGASGSGSGGSTSSSGSSSGASSGSSSGSSSGAGSTSGSSGGSDASVSDSATSDAQGDGGVEAEASTPWAPSVLGSRLAFWFNPSSLQAADGGGIPQWTDLSTNGNNAVQATASYRPAYHASGIGGLPSATFNGPISFLLITDNPTMRWGTGDCAIFSVIRGDSTTSANFAMIYQKTGPSPYNGFDLYVNSAKPSASHLAAAQVSGAVYVDNTAPPSTFIDGTIHLLGGRRKGQTLEIRVDGASSNTLTSDAGAVNVDLSAVGANAAIGQNGGGSPPASENQQFHGDIAELIGVNGALSDADVTDIEQYLKAKYQIP